MRRKIRQRLDDLDARVRVLDANNRQLRIKLILAYRDNVKANEKIDELTAALADARNQQTWAEHARYRATEHS